MPTIAVFRTFLLVASYAITGNVYSQPLVVAADAWCPYNCAPETQQPGYVIELLQKTMRAHKLSVEYRVLPWARALRETEKGSINAAIAVNESEAKEHGLVVGKMSVGVARGCLFVPARSWVVYRSMSDLDQLKAVGIVGGTAYAGDFGQWLAKPENQTKTHAVFGDGVSARRADMLLKGRIDGIWEDYSEMSYVLKQKGQEKRIVLAGCQSQQTPLYVGFSAKNPESSNYTALLDSGVLTMRKNGELSKLLSKYGLTDWTSSAPLK